MKEILPGIHTWSVFSEEKGLDFNGHFIVNDEGRVLIDPPSMDDGTLDAIDALGPPDAIVITNCHHTRDAMSAAARWRARILLNDRDAKAIPQDVRLGGVYRPGDRLPAGLLVIGLQHQKSPGESALLCRKANAIILGDALIGKPPGSFCMLPDAKYADPAGARVALTTLLDHPFDGVLLGDGTSIPHGGRTALERFLSGA